MRECPKCHKVNLATRKFCIRCGASLLKPLKTKSAKVEPSPEETTTPFATPSEQVEPPSPTTDDKWVRPSQVPKDRVRHLAHSSMESEFEKAKRAFERAEEVGFEEIGHGVVETRMLRASEVKELLEGPGEMGGGEPMEISEDAATMAPETEAPMHAPSSEDLEQQILGQWSTLVERESSSEPESVLVEPPESPIRRSSVEGTGFSSARYADESTESVEEPIGSPDIEVPEVQEPVIEPELKEAPQEVKLTAEHVITCPQCKNIITIDGYEYPAEIYSAMADVRLKQAKYLIVQGREHDAKRIVKITRILFEKANDGDGLAQLEQLEESIGMIG
jgi:hypothetical protein